MSMLLFFVGFRNIGMDFFYEIFSLHGSVWYGVEVVGDAEATSFKMQTDQQEDEFVLKF